MSKYAINWDLDSIFKGGSHSEAFKQFKVEIDHDLNKLKNTWENIPKKIDHETALVWEELILFYQSIQSKIGHGISFVECLNAQNTADEKAQVLLSDMIHLHTRLEVIKSPIVAIFAECGDLEWHDFIAHEKLQSIEYWLNYERRVARKKLPAHIEGLITELAQDGYTAWGMVYDQIAGDLRVDFEQDGKVEKLSMGQLSSKFDHPDRNIRRQAFEKLEAAWATQAPMTAKALNHLAGFRRTAYNHRKWDNILEEAYDFNHLQKSTLDTMWKVVEEENQRMKPYLEYKARLLGLEKLHWYDLYAPVGSIDKTFTYDEACAFVVAQMRKISPDIADFCQMAIEKQWVESEDRSGKRAGAFCTGFPIKKETRVFMTYTNTFNNLSTLAHELGHGYHSWVMRDLPEMIQNYPMTLAETASTFNETAMTDSALKTATTDQEKLYLLDSHLQNGLGLFMNIFARFVFETSFYERRKEGFVTVEELNELMLTAQKRAYQNLLQPDGYHPLFWASKLHFYSTDAPFYNFPYTFGFIYSASLYKFSQTDPTGFPKKYVAMLRDTGRLSCEDIVKKHLGADLSDEAFWHETIRFVLSYVDQFVDLAKKVLNEK